MFLGQRIIRAPKGTKRTSTPSSPNEALASIKRKVKALTGRSTTNLELSELIAALNPVLRGWAAYYRHAAAKRTFCYLGYYTWWRVGRWLRKKHPRTDLETDPTPLPQRRPHLQAGGTTLYNPARCASRATATGEPGSRHPWTRATAEPTGRASERTDHDEQPSSNRSNRRSHDQTAASLRAHGEPDAGELARPVRRAAARKPPAERPTRRPAADPTSSRSRPAASTSPDHRQPGRPPG